MSKLQLLKKGFLFQSLAPEELEHLSTTVREVKFGKDQFVFRENAAAASMFIIQSGRVEIIKEGPSGSRVAVAMLEAGGHFGEMSFVDRGPRAAAAMAVEPTNLLEVRYDELEKFVATRPSVGLKLYHAVALALCQRIRHTTSDLAHLILS